VAPKGVLYRTHIVPRQMVRIPDWYDQPNLLSTNSFSRTPSDPIPLASLIVEPALLEFREKYEAAVRSQSFNRLEWTERAEALLELAFANAAFSHFHCRRDIALRYRSTIRSVCALIIDKVDTFSGDRVTETAHKLWRVGWADSALAEALINRYRRVCEEGSHEPQLNEIGKLASMAGKCKLTCHGFFKVADGVLERALGCSTQCSERGSISGFEFIAKTFWSAAMIEAALPKTVSALTKLTPGSLSHCNYHDIAQTIWGLTEIYSPPDKKSELVTAAQVLVDAIKENLHNKEPIVLIRAHGENRQVNEVPYVAVALSQLDRDLCHDWLNHYAPWIRRFFFEFERVRSDCRRSNGYNGNSGDVDEARIFIGPQRDRTQLLQAMTVAGIDVDSFLGF